MDIDSHNAQQAKILWDYFSIISNEDDIDIEEMYQLFVLGWNSELSEDHIFNRDFSGCTAQMFVLIMDSLDVLIRDATAEAKNPPVLIDNSGIVNVFLLVIQRPGAYIET